MFENFELLPYVPTWLWIIFAFVFGLMFGSFANVVIYRLPQKKSVMNPPSACPSCSKRLTLIDLVPILSWLFLRMRCRSCKTKISSRYPLVELICGLLFASIVYYTPTLSAIPLLVLAFLMLVISFIDWDTQEIPDGLVIIGTIVGVAWVALGHFFPDALPYSPSWRNALLGIIAGAAPLLIIDRITLLVLKKDGFGYGDVKLMAMVGIFMGWRLTLGAFPLAILSSFPLALYLVIQKRRTTPKKDADEFSDYMAFGPFLCMGVIIALWFGEWIFNRLFAI